MVWGFLCLFFFVFVVFFFVFFAFLLSRCSKDMNLVICSLFFLFFLFSWATANHCWLDKSVITPFEFRFVFLKWFSTKASEICLFSEATSPWLLILPCWNIDRGVWIQFFFSYTGFHTRVKEPNLPCYFPEAEGKRLIHALPKGISAKGNVNSIVQNLICPVCFLWW